MRNLYYIDPLGQPVEVGDFVHVPIRGRVVRALVTEINMNRSGKEVKVQYTEGMPCLMPDLHDPVMFDPVEFYVINQISYRRRSIWVWADNTQRVNNMATAIQPSFPRLGPVLRPNWDIIPSKYGIVTMNQQLRFRAWSFDDPRLLEPFAPKWMNRPGSPEVFPVPLTLEALRGRLSRQPGAWTFSNAAVVTNLLPPDFPYVRRYPVDLHIHQILERPHIDQWETALALRPVTTAG